MKRNFLFLCLLCCTTFAAAQSLTADAGLDKVWCSQFAGFSMPGYPMPPADTPVLGGLTPASGGTAPYTYSWSLEYRNYNGQVVVPTPTYYLNNDTTAHPKMMRKISVDSMRAVLKVTDALGNTAYDTSWIYFQKYACTAAAEPPVVKHPADTATLRFLWQGCASNFRPYHDFRWMPADYLVDSTVELARTYTPVSKVYYLRYKDSLGCTLGNRIQVLVEPVSVSQQGIEAPSVALNTATRSLVIQGLSTGKWQLTDLNGRTLWQEKLSAAGAYPVPASVAAGMYVISISDAGGKVVTRQKLILP